MLFAYGHLLTDVLDRIDQLCALAYRDPTGTAKKNTATGSMGDPNASSILQTANFLAKELEMRSVLDQVGDLHKWIEILDLPLSRLAPEFWQLRVLIKRELTRKEFVAIPEDLAEQCKADDPFGLGRKFPAAHDDIRSAARCLAVGEPVACVFHLMRAMEFAVRDLARRRKVKITPKSTWRQMTGAMDDKIKRMPDDTKSKLNKRNKWEEARANLHHVGSVWRNNTMHPANTYTKPQAKDIFHYVGLFMRNLCDL